MKKIYNFLLIFLLAFFLIPSLEVKADIYHTSDILTDEEIEDLEEKIDKVEKSMQANIIFYIIKGPSSAKLDSDWDVLESKVDDFYNQTKHQFEYGDKSIVVAFDTNNRAYSVIGYGKLHKANFYDDDEIVYQLSPYFKADKYVDAFEYFLENIEEITEKKVFQTNAIFLGIAFIVNIVIVVVTLIGLINGAGGKVTVSFNNYLNQQKSRIFNKRDIYLRTTTTKTKKVSSSSGGGGSRSGSSGRGRG